MNESVLLPEWETPHRDIIESTYIDDDFCSDTH